MQSGRSCIAARAVCNDGKAKAIPERDLPACDGARPAQCGPTPQLFLFPGMGGYDPNLIEVGNACQEAVRTAQISYPPWRALHEAQGFDFEALVSDAVAQIVRCRPTGPILLAGYSFGGVVAFAAATRLRDAGHAVGFLGLLDIEAQPGLDDAPGALRAPVTRRQEFAGFVAALRRGEGKSKLAYAVARRLKSPRWKQLLRLYAAIPTRWLDGRFTVYLDRDLLSQHMEPLLRQWAACRDALGPLPVPVYLFRTDQHSANVPPHLGWDHCCPDLTVVPVSGTHLGMLAAPNLPALCAAFRNAVFPALGHPR